MSAERDRPPAWRRLGGGTIVTVGVIGSLVGIATAALAFYSHLSADRANETPLAETKQIVSFHQLANRICAENQEALRRALPEAQSRVQLLAFLSRGTGWGVNDLEGVTAPARLAPYFAEEIAEAVKAVESSEESAVDLDRELGLKTCAPVLPRKVKEAIDVG